MKKYRLSLYIILSVLLFFACRDTQPLVSKVILPKPITDTITITIMNPYGINIGLEIKCDWDPAIRHFGYWTYEVLRGWGSTKINLPKKVKQCEIWPKVR